MEWVLGSFTSLLCLHGAPFRPRGLGSVVSVVPAPEMERHVRVRLALLLSAAGQHHDILRPARIEDAPKNGRSRGVSIGAKRSCPAYTSLPPTLTTASRCPSRSERSPCLLSCSSTTSSSMRRAAPRCAPPPPRAHLRSACSVRAGPLTTAPCSSTPSTRRPRR